MSKLPAETFRTIIEHTPLVSIDLLIMRPSREVLVGWRENRPARHAWFVPGGRIAKGETRAAAFSRITQAELGVSLDFAQARLAGAYEHLYEDNVFGDTGYGTHYVVLGYRIAVPADFEPRPDSQHERFRWMSLEAFRDDPDVHRYTRNYLPALE